MNRYEEYQETGFEWLGKIPSNWGLSRVGKFFTERSEKVDDVTYPPLSVTMSGIVDQLSDVAKTNDGGNRKLVKKHDFVINSRSDRKGSSGISPRDGSVSLINIVLEPRELDPQFIQYLFKNYYFKEEYFRNGKGIHWDLWTTRWDQLKNIKFPIPSNKEQELISRYLDKKTVQIDSLIEKIQKKIELLKEKRTSLINQCVTKGLDPNVEMKDSGIEWIGEIPSHWKFGKIKYLSNLITKGTTPSNIGEDFDENGSVRFIKGEDLLDGYILPLGSSHISDDVNSKLKRSQLKVGDLLVVIAGTLGKCAVVTNEILPANTNQAISLIRMKDWVNSNYVRFWFEASSCKNQISEFAVVAAQPNLSMEDLGSIRIPILSEEEQNSIDTFLRRKVENFALKLEKETKRLNLLNEYRQSLIFSVVTGKVRVTEDMI